MNKKSILIIAVVIFIIFGLYANSAIAQTWVNEIVDSIGSQGGYSSIAIDSSDNLHISYHTGFPDYDLKYATNASGSWVTVTVDSSAGSVGRHNSIAIDSSDNVHISYGSSYLKYATNELGSWVTETVDSVLGAGWFTSIAIDSSDNVHISYYETHNDQLKYATNASGSWVNEYLHSKAAMPSSIAIDSSDNVHISYRNTYAGLSHDTYVSGSWVYISVDRTMMTGSYSSIAIDSSDNVHISYSYYGNTALKYATNKGVVPGTGNCSNTDWNCETVDSAGGTYTSIAIDSSDNMHITYMSTYGLKYATNASGSWVTQIVDSDGFVSGCTSIAIDSSDNVHISYSDGTSLKHATNAVQDSDCVYDLNLLAGWNLVSIPCQPSDTDIQTVLNDISGKYLSVWAYENGSWKFYAPNNPVSDLETIEAGKGYWIDMSEAATLTIMGSTPSKTISLNQDWNMVGYNSSTSQSIEDALASIDGKYISVWRLNNNVWEFYAPGNPGSDLTIMDPNYGYWINATEVINWILP